QNPPALSYANEGFQDIILEVTNSFGCFDDTTVSVPVFDVVAQATASTDFISCFANTTAVSFNNTSFNNIDSSSVFWDLGNGTTSTLFNPGAVYNLAGSYVVSMSISSNTGCADTTIVDTIFVGGPYGEVNLIGSDSACFCETVSFEVLTWNATNPSLITGDGGIIPFVPNGILGDSILDTLSYQYCQTGTFVPQLFIDDGTCSGNIEISDTIRVDSVIANFGIGPLPSCDSGTVCFFDSSFNFVQGTAGIDVYNWDFGDGSTSNIANPCHNYTAPGLYNVRLAVQSNFDCRDTTEYQVYIPASPIVSFSQSDSSGCIGLQLLFWDSTSVDSSTSIQSWDWDFGNGAVSAIQNPSATYNVGGLYTATLTVTDSNACVSSDSVNIEVFALPTILASNDTITCNGDSVQLNATGGATYIWQPNYNISDISISNPFVFPTVDTTYVVEGIDVNGCPNWDTVFVEVKQVEAFFSAPSVCLNETTVFTDLSASDGIITDWTWIFGEPSSGANDTSLLQNPTHDYLSQGSFDVTLVVTDDNLCLADSTITVFIQDAPIASFTADSVCFGESHTFNSDSSFAAGANIISYHWDFGVGGTLTDTSNIANTFFTYNTPGLYTVCLTIETDQSCAGNFDDTCFVVQVYELPNVNFILDSACLGNQVNFTDLTVLASNAGALTSFWDFGQNPQDTLLGFSSPLSTQFLYDSTGQYNVTLTVIDSNLCASDNTETAFVLANPAADFSFVTACQNQNNEFVALPSFVSAGNLVYYWDFDEGLGFQLGDSIETYNFVVTGNHQVNLAIVDALGCSDTVQQLIVILDAPSAIITGDNTVCRGVSTTLSGSSSTVLAPPAVYDWSVTASQTSQITYSPNSDTDVFLTVTDNSGCVDSTSVFIDVLEVPEADFDWTDACEDIQISLTSLAQEGDALLINYTWNINSAISGAVTFNTVNANYTVPTIDTLSVTFIVEDANNCIDSINQIIVVDQQVDLDILTPDYLLCPGDSLLVDLGDVTRFVSIGVGGTVWSPTAGIVAISGDSILLAPTTSISYNISASSALGQCPPDDDNFINVDLAPDPFISLDAFPNPVLVGAISNITAGVIPFNVNTDSLIWDNSSGTLNTDFGFNLDASPIEETTYPAQLIYYFDSLRCVKDTAITIFVITECNGELIYIPNIFTPNDDGKNDEFGLIGYGIEVINYLRIFDRWGQLLFDGVDLEMNNGRMFPGAGWLGENQGGKDCNSGVYVYTYELRCANGDVVRGSGNVTLIK
ncbi:MAG: PKD domain-containing protein, partial [Chitinophagales bacterium]|nr:PKD domain-containing protein [Chitinophagales bacterium]